MSRQIDSVLGEYDSVQYEVSNEDPLPKPRIVMVATAADQHGNIVKEFGYSRCLTIPVRRGNLTYC